MDGLSGFLLQLYRLAHACQADEFQTEAMNLLRKQVAFDTGRWAHGTHKPNGERTLYANHMHAEPPELLAAYQVVAGQDRPMLDLLRADAQRFLTRSYRSRDLWEHRPCAAMRDYQIRFRHENVLMAVGKSVIATTAEFRFLGLYRAHPERSFSARDDAKMLALLPHMLQAQTINRVANLATQARLGLDETNGFGIADFSGTLHFGDDRFRMLVSEAWPGAPAGRVPTAMWQHLSSGGRLQDRQLVADAWRAHGMVVMRVRRSCAADTLTHRERQVGQLVADGQTHKQIARTLGITPATARNYLQRLQDKLAVHGKIGIAALLAQSNGPDPKIASRASEMHFVLTPAGH